MVDASLVLIRFTPGFETEIGPMPIDTAGADHEIIHFTSMEY